MTLAFAHDDSESEAPRSQASLAHARLKGELLAGRRAPDEKLKINKIAQKLAVSPGAVREALSRLVPEGLVISRDQKGFVVAPLSIVDLEDLTQIRCDIEEIALRRSVATGGSEWEGAILAAAHQLRRPASDWPVQHDTFHATLVSACGSPRILALRAQLYQQSGRYRFLSRELDERRDVRGEHQALADAALDRNADELVRRAHEHIQRTTNLIKGAFSAGARPETSNAAVPLKAGASACPAAK